MSSSEKVATMPSTTTLPGPSPSSPSTSASEETESSSSAAATTTPAKEGSTSPPPTTTTAAVSRAGQGKQSPPPSTTPSSASAKKTSPSPSPSTSSGSLPTRTQSASSLQLPPNVPVYTKPAILGLPPTAVLTKQEMDFRANLLNPNNDLFWTARGLIRPPVLADALAQGHAILKHEGHLTQKQGGRRLSAQFVRSGSGGSSGPATSSAGTTLAPAAAPLTMGGGSAGGFGTGMNAVVGGSVAVVQQGSWRSAAPPVLQQTTAFVTKEDMDIRANQLNPNNDVFWSSRGLIRPPVLADALAQGHAILQHEGHLTQTQTHKTRGRLNSLPTSGLYSNSETLFLGMQRSDVRRSISGQGLPLSSSGPSNGRIGGNRATNGTTGLWQANPALRRRASTTGSINMPSLGLDSSLVTKDEVDLRANLMNPNNSVFWTSRGLVRPADLQEALAKGHAVLEAEGHTTHAQGGRSKSSSTSAWNRRGSRTEQHGPPAVSPLVAAAQRQWSTPFLAPNAGSTLPQSSRSGGLPGAAWVGGGTTSVPVPVSTRHPDWQSASHGNAAAQRRRYSLPPPGFELFTPPSHFALFRPPVTVAQQQQLQQLQPLVREGAADSEWDKMDESAFVRPPLPPHSAAIPIIKPPSASTTATTSETAKKNEAASWVRKESRQDQKKGEEAKLEAGKMKTEGKKNEEATAGGEDSTKKDATTATTTTTAMPSEPTTPLQRTKVGSLAWQLTQVKLKTAGEARERESESSSKSATV